MPGGHLGYALSTPQLAHRNSPVYPKGAVMHTIAKTMHPIIEVLIKVLIFLPPSSLCFSLGLFFFGPFVLRYCLDHANKIIEQYQSDNSVP
jgi:hypothetical protein